MKSKFIWAKEGEGEANTKLFHNLMNGKRARNAIIKLEKANGELITEDKEIAEEIISFFFFHGYTHHQTPSLEELMASIGPQL